MNEFIHIPPMAGSRIIAGCGGRDSIIKQLSMLDGFTGYAYLKTDTLAISSGYFLSLEPAKIVPFIQNLSQQGIVGITLKGRYFDYQLPEYVLHAANHLNFPIILLAPEIKFYELFDFFYSHIHCYRTGSYLLREQVTSFLVRAIYRDGLDGFAKQLFTWTGRSVFITLQNNIFYYPKEKPAALFTALTTYDVKNNFSMLPAQADQLFCCQTSTAQGLGILFHYKKNQDAMIWLEEPEAPYSTNDIDLLSAAKTACETGVLQIAAFEQDSLQLKERFIDGLISGKINTTSEAVSMAQRLSWFVPQALRVAILESADEPTLCQKIKPLLERYFAAVGNNIIISPYQQQLVLLLPEAISNYREFIQNIYKVLQKKLRQNTLQIAIGGLVQFNKTQRSYRQAKLALAVCAWAAPEQRLNFYDDLGIFKLHGIDDINADIVSMCYTYIKPLIDYEVTSNVNLIETLLVFFHNKQNYSKTGEQLFVHANTVRYRIEQIEKLCHIQFSNYHDVLNLQFALEFIPFVFKNYSLNHDLFSGHTGGEKQDRIR